MQDKPELQKKYNVKIAAPDVEFTGKGKAFPKARPKRSGTPKPRGRSRDSSGSRRPSILKSDRNSSRGSSRSSSAGKNKSVRFSEKGGKGKSKGKPKSKGKRK